ncbi:MAG TPA: hypothetical protein VLA56_03910 [Pseudomonadales bacterium]|nr:hypothetical protein [Pseudomonadales bacterium]
MVMLDPWLVAGFLLAAWSVIANDSIQTLGTFLSSNAHRPWWVLWLFASSVLVVVLLYGWLTGDGDAAYGRLARFPEETRGPSWLYLIPPLTLLALTRFGIPVSTTFLILTVFAPANLPDMLLKTGIGYAIAIALGFAVYRWVVHHAEIRFFATSDQDTPAAWILAQWLATAFLWSQWLIQDLANLYVYLPRTVTPPMLGASLAVIVAVLAWVFAKRGGVIQGIVTRKVNTLDVRSATLIDLIYGLILLVFKEASDLPMSTTWVFIGLLAGRELALTWHHGHRQMHETVRHVGMDAARAGTGIVISVVLALALPWLAGRLA